MKNDTEVDVAHVVVVVNGSSIVLQGDETVENIRRDSTDQPVETLVIRQVRTSLDSKANKIFLFNTEIISMYVSFSAIVFSS